MTSKKLLFFPQNETHLANMLPLITYLEKNGYTIYFLDASTIYKQDIYKNHPKLRLLPICLDNKKPYYTYSALGKLKYTISFKAKLKTLAHHFDGILIGNDGSLQRATIHYFDCKVFFQVDAIINDNTFSFWDIFKHSSFKLFDIKDWIRRKAKLIGMRIVRNLPHNYLFPSEIGTIRADVFYVMGDYVKKILVSRGQYKNSIKVFGLPRFSKIYQYKHKGENLDNKKFKIMTLTQSAVWHNDLVKEEIQKAQIHKFINLIEKMRQQYNLDIELGIRLHPRDIAADRSYFFEKDFVYLLEGDLYTQLMEHDILVASSSTVLVENLAINGRVAVMMLMNQWWRFKRSFLTLPCFHKFFTEEDLEKYLLNQINGETFKRQGLDNLISPKCKNSDELIANDILKHLT